MVTEQGPGVGDPSQPPALQRQSPPARPQGGESQQAASSPQRPTLEDYEPKGGVLVRTYPGHEVVPSGTDLPQFGSEGIEMTQEQADQVLKEFPGYTYVDTETASEGGE